jgi:hypothetical protein
MRIIIGEWTNIPIYGFMIGLNIIIIIMSQVFGYYSTISRTCVCLSLCQLYLIFWYSSSDQPCIMTHKMVLRHKGTDPNTILEDAAESLPGPMVGNTVVTFS